MQNEEAIPFVNAEHMKRYVGRTVRLVGNMQDQGPGTVTLTTSDNQSVTVRVPSRYPVVSM